MQNPTKTPTQNASQLRHLTLLLAINTVAAIAISASVYSLYLAYTFLM